MSLKLWRLRVNVATWMAQQARTRLVWAEQAQVSAGHGSTVRLQAEFLLFLYPVLDVDVFVLNVISDYILYYIFYICV